MSDMPVVQSVPANIDRVLLVEVPHFSSANFHTDPRHRHAFSTRRFDYFVEGKTLAWILPAEKINFVLEVVK